MTSWPDDVTRQLAHCLQFTSGLLDAMDEAVRGDSENIWRYTDVSFTSTASFKGASMKSGITSLLDTLTRPTSRSLSYGKT